MYEINNTNDGEFNDSITGYMWDCLKGEKPPTVISIAKYLPSSKASLLYCCVQLYSMLEFSEYWILKEQKWKGKKKKRKRSWNSINENVNAYVLAQKKARIQNGCM